MGIPITIIIRFLFSADTKKRLMNPETRAKILALTDEKYKIDESKRPADNTPKESFRKLNID